MEVLSRAPSSLLQLLNNAVDLSTPKELTVEGLKAWLVRFKEEPGSALVLGSMVLVMSKWGCDIYNSRRMRQENTIKRKKKQASRTAALEQMATQLSTSVDAIPEYDEILNLELESLLDQLKDGRLKPSWVLEAYQYQALKSHALTNCIVEPLVEAKGYDSSLGCSCFLDEPATADSVIIEVLRNQGAVPFVKTNVSQGMLSTETSNPVFGTTTNPYKSTRSAGGSSGGAATLVATGGALLAIGSGLGSGIRVPAAFNGAFGFRPTAKRISGKGARVPIPGSRLVCPSYGPLSNSLEGLVTFMKAMLCADMFEFDTNVPRMPFDEEVYNSRDKLKIGYFKTIGSLEPAPACSRAVDLARDALVQAGHELVEVTPDFGNLAGYVMDSLTGDQAASFLDLIRCDEIDYESLGLLPLEMKLPGWLKRHTFSFLKCPLMCRHANIGALLGRIQKLRTVREWWQHTDQMDKDVDKFLSWWTEQRLDGVICPAFPAYSLRLGSWADVPGALEYTEVFASLNYPAGVMPITKVTKADEIEALKYPDDSSEQRVMKEDMHDAVGLPVAVQCVTLPWQDELCLRMMNHIRLCLPPE